MSSVPGAWLVCGMLWLTPLAVVHGQDAGGAAEAAAPAAAQAGAPEASLSEADAAAIAKQRPTYPLNTCLACGELWGEGATSLDVLHRGRLVRVCNEACLKDFQGQASKLLKVLDDAIIAAQAATYPLKNCPVMPDEPLGKKPKYVVVGTRMIKVCCGDCRDEVLGDPNVASTALLVIDTALTESQSATYPLKTCLVDDKPLGDSPAQELHGVTLVRCCSAGCLEQLRAAPKQPLAKLQAARRSATPGEAPAGR